VLLPRTLDGPCLAQSEPIKTVVVLCGVVEPRMNAWVPDEIHVQPVFEEVAALLLLPPHPQTVGIENLGTQPAFGQAVQGQQATTVEGTVLNVVNWGDFAQAYVPGEEMIEFRSAREQAAQRAWGPQM
jgi:hypothetical protein